MIWGSFLSPPRWWRVTNLPLFHVQRIPPTSFLRSTCASKIPCSLRWSKHWTMRSSSGSTPRSPPGTPASPDFQPGVRDRTPESHIRVLNQLCNDVLSNFSYYFAIMPEAKGIAQVKVFPLQPLQLGQPNTLVCSVTNLFPPVAEVTWTYQGQPVTQGVSTPPAIPVEDLEFELFSYLEVTPQEGDIYSCNVKSPRDTFSIQTFWVPQNPVPSELLENILCGLAFGVGVLFAIAGVVLVAVSCKRDSTGRAGGGPRAPWGRRRLQLWGRWNQRLVGSEGGPPRVIHPNPLQGRRFPFHSSVSLLGKTCTPLDVKYGNHQRSLRCGGLG
uniref:Ig-like domain-containing protein n=1 Tax=Podarcis muralis TaxID=64176 RepID=A0A670HQY2_PODMU